MKKKIICYSLVICSIFCICYFIWALNISGITTSGIWVWPLGAIYFFITTVIVYKWRGQSFGKLWMIIFFILIFSFFIYESCIILCMNRKNSEISVDIVVLLGGGAIGETASPLTKERTEEAISYLKTHEQANIILCGGITENAYISEAECMQKLLIENGIEHTRITTEGQSLTTKENIDYSKKYITKDTRIAIMTSDYHLFRAMSYAKKQLDNKIIGISVPYRGRLKIHCMVREYMSWVYYLIN